MPARCLQPRWTILSDGPCAGTHRRPWTSVAGPARLRWAWRHAQPVSVRAIDVNPAFLVRGRATAGSTRLIGTTTFLERPLLDDEGGPFDVVVCIGSSGAVGSPREALHRCKTLMAPNGVLVFAELVWAAEPTEEFVAFLGD